MSGTFDGNTIGMQWEYSEYHGYYLENHGNIMGILFIYFSNIAWL